MLIIDDIVKFPMSGLMWIFQEIHAAAEQEIRAEADSLTFELQQLYASFESGQITEEEFDRRETALLDRLDQIQDHGAVVEWDEEDVE
ncbi:MAG: gas vesicle protein GvpG [Desulfomonilaceae bacterium]|nr:gas vesicle protein GvpG [Desulfomonilaceae bacterium]